MPGSMIRYDHLAYLFRSPYVANAKDILRNQADHAGCGSVIRMTLNCVGTPSGDLSPRELEARLRSAFKHFESYTGKPGFIGFSLFVNGISVLARSCEEAITYGNRLLAHEYRNGGLMITSPDVKAHVERVVGLLEKMGAQYLYHPCCWGDLIRTAFCDFWGMSRIMFNETLEGFGSGNPDSMRLLQFANQQLLGAAHDTNDEAIRLRCLNFAERLNRVFEEGESHAVLQGFFEAHVLAMESDGIYDDYERSLARAVSPERAPSLALVTNDADFAAAPVADADEDAAGPVAQLNCDPATQTVSIVDNAMDSAMALFPCTSVR